MNNWTYRVLFLWVFVLVFGCEDGSKKKVFLPESTGSTNQLMVVTEGDIWESRVGDSIRSRFASPVWGLNREEPIFNMIHIPTEAFRGTYRKGRSVLIVANDSASRVQFIRNKYAEAQEIAVVRGPTEDALIDGIARAADSAIYRYKRNEISEVQRRFRRSLQKSPAIEDSFGYALLVPSVYQVSKNEPGFLWLDRPIDKGNMNVLLYEVDQDRIPADSTMITEVIRYRDSIWKEHVPGPEVPGRVTYLATENMFSPFVQETEIAGLKAYELRGLWQMENFPMGGPYLSYWVVDKARGRWLVLDGLVFAPSAIQRDYVFELEAIFRSMRFDDGTDQ